MDMPIIFLSGLYSGAKGFQRTDESNSVTGVFLADGTEVTDGCSYVSEWQDTENKRYALENADAIEAAKSEAEKVANREALRAENESLKQQLIEAQLLETNAAFKAQLAALNNV